MKIRFLKLAMAVFIILLTGPIGGQTRSGVSPYIGDDGLVRFHFTAPERGSVLFIVRPFLDPVTHDVCFEPQTGASYKIGDGNLLDGSAGLKPGPYFYCAHYKVFGYPDGNNPHSCGEFFPGVVDFSFIRVLNGGKLSLADPQGETSAVKTNINGKSYIRITYRPPAGMAGGDIFARGVFNGNSGSVGEYPGLPGGDYNTCGYFIRGLEGIGKARYAELPAVESYRTLELVFYSPDFQFDDNAGKRYLIRLAGATSPVTGKEDPAAVGFDGLLEYFAQSGDRAFLDRYYESYSNRGGPLVSGNEAVFLFKSAFTNADLYFADMTGGGPMTSIAGTPYFYYRRLLYTNAMLQYWYYFRSNKRLVRINPADKLAVPDGMGGRLNAVFMPGYTAALAPHDASRPGGRLVFHKKFPSALLKNNRNVTVYLPPDYDAGGKSYPVLYCSDGEGNLGPGRFKDAMDRLIETGTVSPLIAVLAGSTPARDEEYLMFGGNRASLYAGFIGTELVPFIDANYRTVRDRSGRGILGQSNGGTAAFIIGLLNPSLFSFIASQSANFQAARTGDPLTDDWLGRPSPVAGLVLTNQAKFRVWMDWGVYDASFYPGNCRMAVRLKEMRDRYDLRYAIVPADHNYESWRNRYGEIVRFFESE